MNRSFLFACGMFWLVPALAADAAAPPGRYVIDKGTVYDTGSKLTWQQKVSSNPLTQGNAATYCAGLTTGNGGWRLPQVSELATLVDVTEYNPAIDRVAFPNTPSERFWTATYFHDDGTVSSWYVDFASGSRSSALLTTAYRVRCVR